MTYHLTTPDGRTVKQQLNSFLTILRKKFPSVGYLWILEFQKRGTAHFHLYSTLPHSIDTGKMLGEMWNRIAEPTSKEHLKFHQHKSNFITWDMGSGSYLCKYLDKEAQKAVPPGFSGVGRFWGNSRGLVPDPDVIESNDIVETIGDRGCNHIVRTLCKHHENSLRRSPWRSSARKTPTSYTLPNGAVVVRKLMQYFAVHDLHPPPVPF